MLFAHIIAHIIAAVPAVPAVIVYYTATVNAPVWCRDLCYAHGCCARVGFAWVLPPVQIHLQVMGQIDSRWRCH